MPHELLELSIKNNFIVFTEIFDCRQNLDYTDFLQEFNEIYEQKKDSCWFQYWEENGSRVVLDAWVVKYGEYLKNAECQNRYSDTDQSGKVETVATEIGPIVAKENIEILELNNPVPATLAKNQLELEGSTPFVESCGITWQSLWDEHYIKVHYEYFELFSTVYLNYFLYYINSLESSADNPIEPDNRGEIFSKTAEEVNTFTFDQLKEEAEQIQALGLPLAFGRKNHGNHKNRKVRKSFNCDHFSELFSDDECSNLDGNIAKMELEESVTQTDSTAMKKLNANVTKKTKKRKNWKVKNIPESILADKSLVRYWRKRFSLFSRYDEGIRLDRESWFSVTPETVAIHLAERLKCDILIDGFCGSGGNAIQFAKTCGQVIAIDIDPKKIEMAQHNAKIYGVEKRIEFIIGDFLLLCSSLKGDVVFLSPPWGGPQYKNKPNYDIEQFLVPVPATVLVEKSRQISENIAIFLPRNSNAKQIVKIAGVGKRVEIEHNYLDTKLVAITALYGDILLNKK